MVAVTQRGSATSDSEFTCVLDVARGSFIAGCAEDGRRIVCRQTQATRMKPTKKIFLKRAYEPAAPEDGERYLVDRLWPRGVKKAALVLTGWLKEVAPSNGLRRWFGHDPARWTEFRRRYRSELNSQRTVLQSLRDALKRGPVTLVYSAHDEEHNQAVVLRDFLLETSFRTRPSRREAL